MTQVRSIWIYVLLTFFVLALGRTATASGTQVTWYGHSAFKITTPSGKVLLLDPWITNPANPNGKSDLAGITHADYILITHGHSDHVGDSVDLATRTGAKLVATYDLSNALVAYGGYPKAQAGEETAGNFGGTVMLAGGEVQVTFVPAVHSSAVIAPDDTTGANPHYAGNPGGFLIQIAHGPTIYDTGDTDLFSDMALIPNIHKVDLMLCCIGDHFTMGPSRAADAVQLIRPSAVIPIHYGTFPLLTGTPEAFRAALARDAYKGKLYVMKVDQTLTF